MTVCPTITGRLLDLGGFVANQPRPHPRMPGRSIPADALMYRLETFVQLGA